LEQENAKIKAENAELIAKLSAAERQIKQFQDQKAKADAAIKPGVIDRGMTEDEVREALRKLSGKQWSESPGTESPDTVEIDFWIGGEVYDRVPGRNPITSYRCLFSKKDGKLVDYEKTQR